MAQARRINSVKELNGSTGCGWLINVKLCKLWDPHHFKNWDRVESREMLLMDSNGDRIVVGVHRDHFHHFNEKLIEGTSLLISSFDVQKMERDSSSANMFSRLNFMSVRQSNQARMLALPILEESMALILSVSPISMHKRFTQISRITCTAGFDENAKIDVLQPQPKLGTIDDVITWHKITIEELSTITTPRSNYALIATIEALDPDFRWYYIGCRKCHKSVKEEVVPIAVGTPNNQIPEELYQLVEKRLIFKFEATDYVIQTGSTVYKCTKIIEDPILIKKFENVVCPVESVSSNIPKVTGSSSVRTEYDQDDEPITPVSSIQKWKVVEIDIDDQEHQASTNKKHV
ncbi:OLC1v1030168C1 [Oldenlandia corymbosa var. corymbosa]|uniref:OLC1v1030168C1 n=1 Tax=Oldenlandia corymbosa var. corymbosa TaxID=529605 RepID=A0AAV1CIV6_OLDCO|nr:OLC1v1030168C1 [Oldenlandia corymbosa var. corymbosa]